VRAIIPCLIKPLFDDNESRQASPETESCESIDEVRCGDTLPLNNVCPTTKIGESLVTYKEENVNYCLNCRESFQDLDDASPDGCSME